MDRRERSVSVGRMDPDRTLDGMMIGMRTMFTVGSILSSSRHSALGIGHSRDDRCVSGAKPG